MSRDVTNPEHYKQLDPEPIAVIEKWALGFHLGNALKYIARAGRKYTESAVDDLKKARWYLNRAISDVAPDIEAITTSVTFLDAADRLERALVDLENSRRDAEQWKSTARTLAQRLRSFAVVDDPELGVAAILGENANVLHVLPKAVRASVASRYVALQVADCVPGASVIPCTTRELALRIAADLNDGRTPSNTKSWCSALHAAAVIPQATWCVVDGQPDQIEADHG